MPKIFISYRRADATDVAGRIFDRLVAAFGIGNVFKDVDSIPLGADFANVIAEQLYDCDIVIVIIGRFWLSVRAQDGLSRLHNPKDYVRIEIEQALLSRALVVPALVGSTGMPQEEQLPESIRDLTRRNAIPIRPDPDFHRDVDRLIRGLQDYCGLNKPINAAPAARAPKGSEWPQDSECGSSPLPKAFKAQIQPTPNETSSKEVKPTVTIRKGLHTRTWRRRTLLVMGVIVLAAIPLGVVLFEHWLPSWRTPGIDVSSPKLGGSDNLPGSGTREAILPANAAVANRGDKAAIADRMKKEGPTIIISGESLSLNAVQIHLPVFPEELIKLLGKPTRDSGARTRGGNSTMTWDDLGIFVFVDQRSGKVHDFDIALQKDSLGIVHAWPKRAFPGTLMLDGFELTAESTIQQINDNREEKFELVPGSTVMHCATHNRGRIYLGIPSVRKKGIMRVNFHVDKVP
jgi:hypothetical protein